jgi:PAS domain S-box-containing protein
MTKQKKILIVDDDLHLRNAIKKSLHNEGYSVDSAAGIEECKLKLIDNTPDLLILDVVLPDGDGIDFAISTKNNANYSSLGILLMSGLKTDHDYVSRALQGGALYFSQKPFDIKELVDRVKLIFRVMDLEENRFQLEQRFNYFFRNVTDITFILGSKSEIIEISKSYEDISGLSAIGIDGKMFSDLLTESSVEKFQKNFNSVVEGKIIPSFQIEIKNVFDNIIPIELFLSRSGEGDQQIAIIGIAKDLRSLQDTDDSDQDLQKTHKRELSSWEKLEVPSTRITTKAYEVSVLQDNQSKVFKNMLNAYSELVEFAIQQRIYKLEGDNSIKQRMFANELGFLKAGPRDLVSIHTAFYKSLAEDANMKKLAVYHEEARIILLNIMGRLVSFYKNNNLKKI